MFDIKHSASGIFKTLTSDGVTSGGKVSSLDKTLQETSLEIARRDEGQLPSQVVLIQILHALHYASIPIFD